MKNQVFAFICLAAAAGVGALVVLVIGSSNILWLGEFFVASAAAVISGMMCLVSFLLGKKKNAGKSSISPWKLFAVIDLILIAALIAWSVWDLNTDKGLFAGIGGALGLYFGVPLLGALLIVEYLVYRTVQMRSNNDDAPAKTSIEPVDIVNMKKNDWRNEK